MATITATKERPILFSSSMVKAILAGEKTQTRRIINLDKLAFTPSRVGWLDDRDDGPGWYAQDVDGGQFEPAECWGEAKLKCPYGKPGDRLWVRETWRTAKRLDGMSAERIAAGCYEANYSRPWAPIKYEADGLTDNAGTLPSFDAEGVSGWGRKRVSIHMPRWASRITLEIADVRVGRVQDISEEDALEEGASLRRRHDNDHWSGWGLGRDVPTPVPACYSRRDGFRHVWETINGLASWQANPWVWAVSFRRA